MTHRVLLDTGPLVAIVSERDHQHAACVVDLAEREGIETVFTLDRRDFLV